METEGKLEVEIVGRKIEVRVIEGHINQYGGLIQRVYAKFIDGDKNIPKVSKTQEEIKKLKEKLDKIPDGEI